MNRDLDEVYLIWLYGQVAPVHLKTRRRTFWVLFKQLYTTEFVWTIPMDENRAEDGIALREQFLDEEGEYPYATDEWKGLACSVLEMLIALSRRVSFEADQGDPRAWFWELMHNLRLDSYTDATHLSTAEHREVNHILETLMLRRYNRSGKGGLFPLRRPDKDQRNVDIWYQMNAYLNENE